MPTVGEIQVLVQTPRGEMHVAIHKFSDTEWVVTRSYLHPRVPDAHMEVGASYDPAQYRYSLVTTPKLRPAAAVAVFNKVSERMQKTYQRIMRKELEAQLRELP